MYRLDVVKQRSKGWFETIDDMAYNPLRACIDWLHLRRLKQV